MDSRLAFFLLGVAAAAGLPAAAVPECPPGFRCAGAPVAGETCRIEEGPYRGETGTLVDGRCLRSPNAGSGPVHTHVLEQGRCPLCGGGGEEFLAFNVQGGAAEGASGGVRPARYEARRILRCTVCANLFAAPR
jgi:hypothetical protein